MEKPCPAYPGAAHVLFCAWGSARKSGNTIRITAQLIDAVSGSRLWSGTFDREMFDIFAIQDEIAGQVVEQLNVTLLGKPATRQEVDPEAARLFRQVLAGVSGRNRRGTRAACHSGQDRGMLEILGRNLVGTGRFLCQR